MRQFNFTLARVLAWRRAQATLEKNRLDQIRARHQALLDRRQAFRRETREAATEATGVGVESTPTSLTAREFFGRFAREEDARLQQAIESAGRELAAQQSRVRNAEQASQLLERLQGKRWEEWQTQAAKELEELAADVFLAKWPGRK